MARAALEFRHQRLVGGRQPARNHHPHFGRAGRNGQQEYAENGEREGAELDRKTHDGSSPDDS